MRVRVKRFYPLDVESVFTLWTDFDRQLEWLRLPDWMKFEKIVDDNGDVVGAAVSCLSNGKWITTTSKSIYFKANEETRCLVTGISDQDGNDLLNHPHAVCKTIAHRALFKEVDNGTALIVEHHLEPTSIFRVWDTLWLLPEYKKRTRFLMDLLTDFVNR